MKINVRNEVVEIENGTYNVVIDEIFQYNENNICMKFSILNDPKNMIFVQFLPIEKLESYPWINVFKALETNDTDDLIGHTFKIEVVNNKSKTTGKEFCNIKKVTVVE